MSKKHPELPDPEPQAESLPKGERIRRRAYEIYLRRGGEHGADFDDWLQAEAEIIREDTKLAD